MSASDAHSSDANSPDGSGPAADEEPLLDINGNPIPRNWNPTAVPPPDAEPPGAAKRPAAGNPRPSAGNARSAASGAARPPAPRPSPPPRAAPGGALPGQEEVRYDLAGNPIVYQPPPPEKPGTLSGMPSKAPARKPEKFKRQGASPLGPLFSLIMLALICYAGFVIYNKYQHNTAVQAAPGASTDASSSPAPIAPATPAPAPAAPSGAAKHRHHHPAN